MPHINEIQRAKYSIITSLILDTEIENKGDLEYLVYQLMKSFMKTRESRYSTLHEAVYGTIHSAEEFKRLYLDRREDIAIKLNGEA